MKMSNWLNANSFNEKDEYYTPKILVEPILKYIKKDWVVWCPFDESDSEFVLVLKENNIKVIHSHIFTGQNFFEYEPNEHYDCIISNPPFSTKLKVLKRLYELNKPFAILLGTPIINYQEIGNFFYNQNSDIQFCFFDKKVSFNGLTSSFNTSYFCRNFLIKDVIFEHLEHNNSGKYYVPSRMIKEI